jgi:hypothetical protein
MVDCTCWSSNSSWLSSSNISEIISFSVHLVTVVCSSQLVVVLFSLSYLCNHRSMFNNVIVFNYLYFYLYIFR